MTPNISCPYFNGELCTGSITEQAFCVGKCEACEYTAEEIAERDKEELIKKYTDLGQSLEGSDACLHGVKLYENCFACGRLIQE